MRFDGRQGVEEAGLAVDVVILEVDALQPRVLPGQALLLAEHIEQPFLGNPIDPADEQLRAAGERIEGERPVLEDPIGLLISAAEVLRCVLEEGPLDVQRGAAAAIVQLDARASGAFAGNLPRAQARRRGG